MNLYLKEPTIQDKDEVINMCNELDTCGDEYPFEGAYKLKYLLDMTYEEWLKKLEEDKTIEDTNPNWSNATSYILVDDNNHACGFIQLRYSLKGNLINIGGNIGYAIRPSERKKGYATKQLGLALEKANEYGLEKVLITCRDNNIGSKKTIEKYMGEEIEPVPSNYPNIMELRYWVNTKQYKKIN